MRHYNLVHVAADPGEQCERSGQLAETAGDVLNGDAAVLQAWLNCSMSLTALSTYGVSLPFNCSTNGVSWLESASTDGMAALNVLRNDSSAILPGPSPNRLRAAFTFANAPLNVSPAANAAPPRPSCMESANVWKSICLGHHVGDLFRGFAEVFGEQLEDGYAGAHELEHVVALQFASGGDAAEDGARCR